jgi:hypothetical protein
VTVGESLKLMQYPEGWSWPEGIKDEDKFKVIGNSIPPGCVRHLLDCAIPGKFKIKTRVEVKQEKGVGGGDGGM